MYVYTYIYTHTHTQVRIFTHAYATFPLTSLETPGLTLLPSQLE